MSKPPFTILRRAFAMRLKPIFKSFFPPPNHLKTPLIKKLPKEEPKVINYLPEEKLGAVFESTRLASTLPPVQKVAPGPPCPFKGQVLNFSEGLPYETHVIEPPIVAQHNVVVCTGLGGGAEDELYRTWFATSRFLPNDPSIAVYVSVNEGEGNEERYRQGSAYYYDSSYINEKESKNYFEKVLKNKFFNKYGKLKKLEEINPLTLIGYSIGYREIKSHTNYLYEKIKEALVKEGRKPEEAQNYFDRLIVYNVGSPVNWENRKVPRKLLDELVKGTKTTKDMEDYLDKNTTDVEEETYPPVTVRTIHYAATYDRGTKKSDSFINNVVLNAANYGGVNLYERPDSKDGREVMYVIGFPFVYEPDAQNHVYKSPNKHHDYALYLASIERINKTTGQVQRREWLTDRIPSDDDMQIALQEWRKQIFLEDLTRVNWHFKENGQNGQNR